MIDITMPSLGSDMTEGTLVEWLVNIGDQVSKGDIVAVIETQKGAIDMEAYNEGKVAEILVQPVTKVPVGTILARLESGSDIPKSESKLQKGSEAVSTGQEENVEEPFSAQKTQPIQSAQSARLSSPGSDVRASPAVRKMAEDLQLDLSLIKGSGPSGAILLDDITGLVDGSNNLDMASAQTKTNELNFSAMRAAISSAMEKSKREIPHYYISLDIDISKVQQWLQTENIGREPEQRLLLLAVLLKAVAQTLIKFPQLNGYYLNNQFQAGAGIHIGNAISLRDGGLLVPAIHDVEKLSVDETMKTLRDIANRSRGGRLRSSELTDATITVTSMGERGSDTVFGIIYPPQVAIIGFGRPRQAPQVMDGVIVPREMINTGLSADHRVSDGVLGAKFLHALSNKLQNPESL